MAAGRQPHKELQAKPGLYFVVDKKPLPSVSIVKNGGTEKIHRMAMLGPHVGRRKNEKMSRQFEVVFVSSCEAPIRLKRKFTYEIDENQNTRTYFRHNGCARFRRSELCGRPAQQGTPLPGPSQVPSPGTDRPVLPAARSALSQTSLQAPL